MQLIFVYGTLKRGGGNHRALAGQVFIGPAQTSQGFRLFDLGGYPGMVHDLTAPGHITGEVWQVDAACLGTLDKLEGLKEGLYRRERVPLASPFETSVTEAYLYARTTTGLRDLGSTWQE